jgi:hypothetical protein
MVALLASGSATAAITGVLTAMRDKLQNGCTCPVKICAIIYTWMAKRLLELEGSKFILR